MNRLLGFCAGLALMLGASAAMAADISGTWVGTAQGPGGGDMQLTFTFRQDGTSLTGSVRGPMGDAMDISNGKIDGDKFTFDVSFNGMTIHHECTVNGDEIKMTTKPETGNSPGVELTLKRVKDAAPAPPTQ